MPMHTCMNISCGLTAASITSICFSRCSCMPQQQAKRSISMSSARAKGNHCQRGTSQQSSLQWNSFIPTPGVRISMTCTRRSISYIGCPGKADGGGNRGVAMPRGPRVIKSASGISSPLNNLRSHGCSCQLTLPSLILIQHLLPQTAGCMRSLLPQTMGWKRWPS